MYRCTQSTIQNSLFLSLPPLHFPLSWPVNQIHIITTLFKFNTKLILFIYVHACATNLPHMIPSSSLPFNQAQDKARLVYVQAHLTCYTRLRWGKYVSSSLSLSLPLSLSLSLPCWNITPNAWCKSYSEWIQDRRVEIKWGSTRLWEIPIGVVKKGKRDEHMCMYTDRVLGECIQDWTSMRFAVAVCSWGMHATLGLSICKILPLPPSLSLVGT
jgi:hypothetical protein